MVCDNADNGCPRRISVADFDAFADRVFIKKKVPRKRFVNDYDMRFPPDFLLGEGASAKNVDAHRAEVIGRDTAASQDRFFTFRNIRTALDHNRISRAIPSHQQRKANGRRLYAWQLIKIGKRLLKEIHALQWFGVATVWQAQAHCQQVVRIEPWFDVAQVGET